MSNSTVFAGFWRRGSESGRVPEFSKATDYGLRGRAPALSKATDYGLRGRAPEF